MPNYDKISTEMFQNTLEDIVDEQKAGDLLGIPGIYEVLAEHFNNEVLERRTCDHCGGDGFLEPEEMEEFACPHCDEGIR